MYNFHEGTYGASKLLSLLDIRMESLPKVLIVDDNDLIRDLLTAICSNYNLKCQCATNGQEAVHIFKKETFRIILMDLDMPVMDGFEATGAIRQYEIAENCKHTPVIAISGKPLINPLQTCCQAGMDGFLPKPIIIAELLDILKTATDCET